MTETLVRARRTAAVTIRAYRPTDHRDCRQLWAELAREHQERYADPNAADAEAGDDLGAGFEEYLTRLDLSGLWVAEAEVDGIVGFVGLLLAGSAGEVEPVVVSAARRGEGIGRALLEHVADQARKRGLRQLTIAPAARNLDAIRCLHAAGYDAIARLTLAIDLSGRGTTWQDGLDVHDLRFRY